jgi:hypothetical protein
MWQSGSVGTPIGIDIDYQYALSLLASSLGHV